MITQTEMADYLAVVDYIQRRHSVSSCLLLGVHNENAEITYLVPTFQRLEFLSECLMSILAQECSSFVYEIVVVDNQPLNVFVDSDVMKAIKSFNDDRILYYVNSINVGPMGNWNQCLKLARTEWVCMVHDDDVIPANHLSIMKRALNSAPKADCIACNCLFLNMLKNPDLHFLETVSEALSPRSCTTKPKAKTASYHLYGFRTLLLGALIRRESALKIGGFGDPARVIFEDYIFMTKLLINCKVYKIEVKAYGYRIQQNDSLNFEMWEQEQIDEYFFKQQLAIKCHANPIQKFIIKARTIMRVLDANCAKTSSFGTPLGINMKKIMKECGISVFYYPFGTVGHTLKRIRNALFTVNQF